jgi:16S rRNA (guanine527-N7)-methyltransferase
MNQSGQLERGQEAMGVALSAGQREKLLAYLALLYKWNRTYRLTAVHARDQAISRHLLDSLSILPFIPQGRLLDVGSGGGAPGIPLAIARPDLMVTLLDGNAKKAAFLRQAAIELELTNVSVHGGRVEQYHPEIGFSAVVSRAFAELADFVAMSRHLPAAEGIWLAMKGVRPEEEIDRLPEWVCVEAVYSLVVPGIGAARHLIIMRRAVAD